jgi:sterol desaturase/sphingolipid hydroxylase (fatty acid hydroxylase superfamily)
LNYARPPTAPAGETARKWEKPDALLRIGGGFVAVVLGLVMLMTPLLRWWAGRWLGQWQAQWFLGSVFTLAGFVFCVRPLYRMVRGGAWWKVE